MTHRALVLGAGNAGKAHAEALTGLGIEAVGPLSGTATMADLAPLRDPDVDMVHVTPANDLPSAQRRRDSLRPDRRSASEPRCPNAPRALDRAPPWRPGRTRRLPRYELAVEEASAGFAALRRPAEVLQVVFRYV